MKVLRTFGMKLGWRGGDGIVSNGIFAVLCFDPNLSEVDVEKLGVWLEVRGSSAMCAAT